jgi:DNA repair exonuclease SbcCD ATPase subunit
MSNKRKNTTISDGADASWEETKAKLAVKTTFGWIDQWNKVQGTLNLDAEMDQLHDDSEAMKTSLANQIQQEREAFQCESDDIFKMVQTANNLQGTVSDLEQSLEEVREKEMEIRSHIHSHQQAVSEQREEIDAVEMDRMQQVPKIKNQISLYAKTTGIRWDYHRDSMLAGEVVRCLLLLLLLLVDRVVQLLVD